MMIRIFKLILILAFGLGLQQLIELKTRGFCLQRIFADDLALSSEWEVAPLSPKQLEKIDKLLSQPYTLLGGGSECFAFLSQDKKTVIKFFKLDLMRPVFLHRGLLREDYSAHRGILTSNHSASKWAFWEKIKSRLLGMREYRLHRTFSSLKLAYQTLKKETALLYLHLNPTSYFHRSLTVYDGCGIAHQVDLDTTKFFLQRKIVPVEQHFSALKAQGEHQMAKISLDSLLELLLVRCSKGIFDRDILNRNWGFIDTRAAEIDVGSFSLNPRMRYPWVYQQELFYGTLELRQWLKKNYPELLPSLDEKLQKKIKNDTLPYSVYS